MNWIIVVLCCYFPHLQSVERRPFPLERMGLKNGQPLETKLVVMGRGPMGLELPCLSLMADGTVMWDAGGRNLEVTLDFGKIESLGYAGGLIQVAYETILTSESLGLLLPATDFGPLWELDADGYQREYGGGYYNEIFVVLDEGLLVLRSNHEHVERNGGRILTTTGVIESSEDPLEYIIANEPADYANFRIAWEGLKGFAMDVITLAESQPYGPQTSVISSRMREEGE